MQRGIKEEPIDVDEHSSRSGLDVVPRYAYSTPRAPDDDHFRSSAEENLVPLRPHQFGKLKFSPPCPVLYKDAQIDDDDLVQAAVVSAFLDIDTREVVYQLDNSHLVSEKDLLYGIGVPVWARHPASDESITAIILQVFSGSSSSSLSFQGAAEPSYSVQDVQSQTVYHFLSSVEYRRDGSFAPAPSATPAAAANLNQASGRAAMPQQPQVQSYNNSQSNAGRNSVVSPAVLQRNNMDDVPTETFSDRNAEVELVSQPNEISRRQRSESDYDLQEESAHNPPKRSRHEPVGGRIRRMLLLPRWLPLSEVNECFHGPNKEEFKSNTHCSMGIMRYAHTKKVFIALDGSEKTAVNHAAMAAENMLIDCLGSFDEKILLLHDMAFHSPGKYYMRKGIAVYQRDITTETAQWNWMHIFKLPDTWGSQEALAFMVGANDVGALEIVEGGLCYARVIHTRQSKLALYLAGKLLHSVVVGKKRAQARIRWVEENRTASRSAAAS